MTKHKKIYDVVIIGAGIFGSEIAIKINEEGFSSMVLEEKSDILCGASKNNQNRLHLGFHYPRDLETGRQCIKGFKTFKDKYKDCINENFLNAYFVASKNSFISKNDFINHANALNLPYKEINLKEFPLEIKNVDFGLECEEVVYDCSILRDLVRTNIKSSKVDMLFNYSVREVAKNGDIFEVNPNTNNPIYSRSVINCSYSDINFITSQLGYDIDKNLYEYTVVPIIDIDIPQSGITVMDGPFMTLLPYGKSKKYLLYHVKNSVIAREESLLFNQNWNSPSTGPFNKMNKEVFFKKMIEESISHLPFLKSAKLKGFLEGPRMVLSNNDATDARPSVIKKYENTYITVFSGKIDHSIWVAEDIKNHLISALK